MMDSFPEANELLMGLKQEGGFMYEKGRLKGVICNVLTIFHPEQGKVSKQAL